MKKTNKFSPEVRERAVRIVQEQRGEYPSTTNYCLELCSKCNATMTRAQAQAQARAMAYAYAYAGIPNGGGPGFTPVPWKPKFNPPRGFGFNSRPWADFQQTYYPPNFGWSGPNGSVEEHPLGHPDIPGGLNHDCPHFFARNAQGVPAEFPYRPGF